MPSALKTRHKQSSIPSRPTLKQDLREMFDFSVRDFTTLLDAADGTPLRDNQYCNALALDSRYMVRISGDRTGHMRCALTDAGRIMLDAITATIRQL